MSILIRFNPPSLTAEAYDQVVRRLNEDGVFPADGPSSHLGLVVAERGYRIHDDSGWPAVARFTISKVWGANGMPQRFVHTTRRKWVVFE